MDDDVEALVAEQVDYYHAHAPDYDVAYLGKDWDRCIQQLPITGDVLELACGTGHWTPLLAARARSVTAIDAAPEALALARRRTRGLPVEFVQADVFAWQPPRRFDTVFFAFWLTHVPPARFAAFWSMVDVALAPGGRACFVDDSDQQRAGERFVPDQATPAVWRPLRDGTQHRVVKVYYARASWRPGWPGWAGRQTSRPATRCWSEPPIDAPTTPSGHRSSPSSSGSMEPLRALRRDSGVPSLLRSQPVGQHSDPSFEEFFAATYARLVGLLFALLHDQAQAEDAVQDAFASALLRWRSLRGYRSTAACQPGWTQVDLASGHRRPAFGGLTGVGEFSLSADGRWLAYVHTTPPEPGTPPRIGPNCRTDQLVVRELASGRQRAWTIPPGVLVEQVQLNADATQLAYLLTQTQGPREQRALHLLRLADTTSVTQGFYLPQASDCPVSTLRFVGSRRLLVLGGRGCDTGPVVTLLVDFDLSSGQVSRMALGLPGEVFSIDADRSGRHVIIAAAGKPNQQRPATVYVLRGGQPQRVPLPGDCWQADW